MNYIALNIAFSEDEQAEILTAELADYPFESFETEDGTLKAYIPQERLADCKAGVDALLARYGVQGRYIAIETQNWNAVWESNFPAVDVEGRLLIRAPFHDPAPEGVMEVVVMPKMSFGTGHHATTWLVSRAVLDLGVAGRRGLDMGSGTGSSPPNAARSMSMRSILTTGPTPTAARISPPTVSRTALRRCWATCAASPDGITVSFWPTSTATSSWPTCRPMPPRSTPEAIW